MQEPSAGSSPSEGSSHNSLLCWALFDRAAERLAVMGGTLRLGDEGVSGPVLDRYRIGIL